MSEQTLRRYITGDQLHEGDRLVTPINGEHVVGTIKSGGLSGGCETDLYLAYECSVGDCDYNDADDDLPFLSEEDVPDWLSI